MIPLRTMRPSIARVSQQLDPRLQPADIPPPQSATLGLHPVARKLRLISRPAEGRRLSQWLVNVPSNSRLFCGTPDAARCGPRRARTDDILPGWRHRRPGDDVTTPGWRHWPARWAAQTLQPRSAVNNRDTRSWSDLTSTVTSANTARAFSDSFTYLRCVKKNSSPSCLRYIFSDRKPILTILGRIVQKNNYNETGEFLRKFQNCTSDGVRGQKSPSGV